MNRLTIEEFGNDVCDVQPHTLEDYESDIPRWCKGCGDHGVLLNLQQLLLDERIEPENVVAVSGIGCSSRLPHYLRAYGFHGVHGRALPISLGVKLARPDLNVITVMGDGDCFSIGAGHWLHTLRYNVNILVLVLDNGIYALTKKQASPTSPQGTVSNTSPFGSYLQSLNPLSLMLGISNMSFLAQSATWLPTHMEATMRKAWDHKGLSFVRILQRCPVYMPDQFGVGSDLSWSFLEDENGIAVDPALTRRAVVKQHNPRDLKAAQQVALRESPSPMGLLYWNPDLPTYEEVRHSHAPALEQDEFLRRLDDLMDKYTVHSNAGAI